MAKPDRRLVVPSWSPRLATADDMGFVYSSWIDHAAKTYPNMHAQDFRLEERARAQHLVERSIVAVADIGGAEDNLLGHIVYGRWRNTLAIHYAFVKPDARRAGVFASLVKFANFESLPVVLTAPAQDPSVMQSLAKRYIYNQQVQQLMRRGER
jgi:hypothetical protein